MEAETLRWIWLVAGVVLLVGEMSTATLIVLPFAIGAFAAAALAFLGASLAAQLVACAAVSTATFIGLRPLAKRMDRDAPTDGIGSQRLVNAAGAVIAEIPTGEIGTVKVGSEEWRAESFDGQAIEKGARIRVLNIRGTRAVVAPFEAPVPDALDRPETD